MAFVHHTASGNSYSRSQAPAVVRAIYYYHVKGAGFNDLGYNFLIDRFGTVYEGRYGGVSEGVVGAHTLGFNTSSTGVALMGTFTSSPPPSAALTSLKKLLAWKLDVHHVDPTASARMTCRASEKYNAGQVVKLGRHQRPPQRQLHLLSGRRALRQTAQRAHCGRQARAAENLRTGRLSRALQPRRGRSRRRDDGPLLGQRDGRLVAAD